MLELALNRPLKTTYKIHAVEANVMNTYGRIQKNTGERIQNIEYRRKLCEVLPR